MINQVDELDKMLDVTEHLVNSPSKLLDYSDVPCETADSFKVNLEAVCKMRTRSFNEGETRKVRESVTSHFFEIYIAIAKKILSNQDDEIGRLFIDYGFMDERLLEPGQIHELCKLKLNSGSLGNSSVYFPKDWLQKIYNQEKDPSINEFGQDYYEVFREKRKKGELRDSDKNNYENDMDSRLRHEVFNLFRIGQRLCCGQMGAYFPILHSGLITRNLSEALLTPEKITESLNRILQVDFSAFHREITYNQPGKGISKELIMKSVYPDIILMPTFGTRGIMWQDLSGRVRSSPARFVFPVFTAENLDNLMIEVIARFRWELSRSMFSYSRNNSEQSSLCNDYSNYIQFYKKNRDLSDDAKEKVRLQVDKCRNNIADIFAADYHTWINFESKGLVRLNKAAREILFKYCPFSKGVRNQLENHPLYNQIISRFKTQREKQTKILKAHYSKLVGPGSNLDTDLLYNLMYYNL